MSPLFPLQTVLFPGGLLQLKIFEARYLDMVSQCLRAQSAFTVVCLQQGSEVRNAEDASPRFESLGVEARLLAVDAEQPGILQLRCQGGRRMRLGPAHMRADGLWLADATPLPADDTVAVPADLQACARALQQAIQALDAQGHTPFLAPYKLDDAGWVANRWCELLPMPLPIKQALMALDEPVLRLQQVQAQLVKLGAL